MYILTNQQMRAADEYTMKTLGVPSLLLMERAGIALADEAESMTAGKIVCVCGGGNNGGDGFVCARILKSRGREVAVVFYAEKQSADCRINMEKWVSTGGEILEKIPEDVALIVDCMYGTGFRGALLDSDMGMAKEINARKTQGAKVLSADMPSGVNGENGNVEGVAVFADKTLCLGALKMGALLGDGIDHAGELLCVDIGIELPEKDNYAVLSNEAYVASLLPIRKRNSHKGTYGKAAIVAGSFVYSGAAYLAASACLHAGAGYTALFTPSALLPHFMLKSPEILLRASNEGGMYAFNEERMQALLEYNSVAYGMGMGMSEEVAKGAIWLLQRYEGKLILDADGINSLAAYHKDELLQIFHNKKCDVILTPHSKEFSRLTGIGMKEVMDEGYSMAKSLAEKWSINVLLKNAVSVITDGQRAAFNASGCSGQAKGGSGDVLAGVVAGLCAAGLSAYEAGVVGAFITGKAAELASQIYSEYALTASDVIAYLGKAFLLISENANEQGRE